MRVVSSSFDVFLCLFQVFVNFARQQRDEEDGAFENDVDLKDEIQTSATWIKHQSAETRHFTRVIYLFDIQISM